MSFARRATALLLVGALGGCPVPHAVAPEPDPALAVAAYRDALVEGRVADAFALVHPDAREGLDLEGFTMLYRGHRAALVAQAERLVTLARSGPPSERAVVTHRLGTSELVRTPEGWRLTAPVGAGAPGAADGTDPAGATGPTSPADPARRPRAADPAQPTGPAGPTDAAGGRE